MSFTHNCDTFAPTLTSTSKENSLINNNNKKKIPRYSIYFVMLSISGTIKAKTEFYHVRLKRKKMTQQIK